MCYSLWCNAPPTMLPAEGVWSAGWIENPRAHHQEKIAVSMRHWYLSLCMGGVWSAGWIENPRAHHQEKITVSIRHWYLSL